MIRERLQLVRNALSTRLEPIRESMDEFAVDSLDDEITGILNSITEHVETVELNEEEKNMLYLGWSNDSLNEAMVAVQTAFKLRFYELALKPALGSVYRLRLVTLFLSRSNYNNYVMKVASMFEAFSRLNSEITIALIRGAVEEFDRSKTEAAEALIEFKAYGNLIEE